MDDQDRALNEEAEVETAEDTTPVSEETAEVDSTTTEEVAEEKESKKGYTARVRESVNRAKAAEAEAESLRAKLAELTSQVGNQEFSPQQPPLEPLVRPGEEVTIEELNKRQTEREAELLKRASQMSNLQAQQVMAIERINREAKELTRKYEALNPQSEDFDKELSDTITEAAEAYVRANPTKSLEEFVDKQMRLHQRAVTREAKAEKAEITKQAGQSALRPSTTKPVDKKFEDLSIEEMEAKLGYAR